MALTVKTIIKLFMLFLAFQISINILVEVLPDLVPNFSVENQEYLDFVADKTNAQLDAEATGTTLLDNLQSSMETENFFNDSLIDTFLGLLQVLGQMLRFIFVLCLAILFTPTIIMEILLYNFIASSTILFSLSLVVNIFFYMMLFYIIFRARTTQG